ASGYIRKIPAVRHGAWRGASLGTGFRRDYQRSAELVRVAQRLRGIQPHSVLEFYAQHGYRYASGVRFRTAIEFNRLGLERRRRRQRILTTKSFRTVEMLTEMATSRSSKVAITI